MTAREWNNPSRKSYEHETCALSAYKVTGSIVMKLYGRSVLLSSIILRLVCQYCLTFDVRKRIKNPVVSSSISAVATASTGTAA